MAGKGDQYYYSVLSEGIDCCIRAVGLLLETLKNYHSKKTDACIRDTHTIEHVVDLGKHAMMSRLVKEFITPIEREDIIELAQTTDDATDEIEDIVLRLHTFHTKIIRPETLQFGSIAISCCKAIKSATEELHNSNKSGTIHQMIIDINRMEEDGDKLYTDAIHVLYADPSSPIEILTWTEIFNRLECCYGACEDVVNVVESVIMRNI